VKLISSILQLFVGKGKLSFIDELTNRLPHDRPASAGYKTALLMQHLQEFFKRHFVRTRTSDSLLSKR
jgi:hypothetical protein